MAACRTSALELPKASPTHFMSGSKGKPSALPTPNTGTQALQQLPQKAHSKKSYDAQPRPPRHRQVHCPFKAHAVAL